MRDTAGQLPHGFHLLGLQQGFLGGSQPLGRHLLCGDVAGNCIVAVFVRDSRPGQPAIRSVLVAKAAFELDRGFACTQFPDLRLRYSVVLGMLQPFRRPVQQFSFTPAERAGPCRIDRLPEPVAVRHHQQILRYVPDPVAFPCLFLDTLRQRRVQLRKLIGKLAIQLFALPKRLLRHDLLGDVSVGADQTDRISMLVALDGRFHRNPPRLAVAGTNNPVLHAVFAHIACDGVTEFLFGRLTVFRVDAPDPILVALGARIRREAVDRQILRRAAIAETSAQIDLETADSTELLHARQLRLAFAQRGRGDIVLGHVTANHEHAADATAVIDRAIAVRPIDLLESAVARDRNELIFMPGRAATAHHLLDLRTDDGPDFGPALPPTLTERAWMPLGAHRLAVGVVIKLDQLRTPPDEHRVVCVEHYAYRRAKTLRPSLRPSQRVRRPAIGSRQRAHLPAAGEKIRMT